MTPRVHLFIRALLSLGQQNKLVGISLIASVLIVLCLLWWALTSLIADIEPIPFPIKEDWHHVRHVWNKAIASHIDIYPPQGLIDDNERNTSATWQHYKEMLKKLHHPKRAVTIYIVSTQLKHFLHEVVPHITRPFVLVSGCSDQGPLQVLGRSQLDALLSSPYLRSWFAQNCDFGMTDVATGKVHCVPIGIDFHTQSEGSAWWGPQLSPLIQDSLLHTAGLMASPHDRRLVKAFMDFSIHSNKGPRAEIYLKFSRTNFVDYPYRSITRADLWLRYQQYAFVLSPPGNGKDCHRTWEALALGSVPIMLKSSLDPLFEGLPVVLIESWDEVTLPALQKWHEMIGRQRERGQFHMERIMNEYWVGLIRSASEER